MLNKQSTRILKISILLLGTLIFQTARSQKKDDDGEKAAKRPNNHIRLEQGALNFLAMGDWGRDGKYFQTDVSHEMENFAREYNARFIVALGDNFYKRGVQSVTDNQWKTSFEDIYTGAHLQVPWYAVLGNHDYGGKPDAQIAYTKVSKRWNMPSRYYSKTIKLNDTSSVLLVFIDTNPFLTSYQKKAANYSDIHKQDATAQLSWIDSTLSHSRARWKFVFGHHPVYSAGSAHGNTQELIDQLKPVLEKDHAQIYFCGHEHDLQHLKPLGATKVNYIVSGAGSETRPAGFIDDLSRFSCADGGFVMVSVGQDKTAVYMVNYKGEILYKADCKVD